MKLNSLSKIVVLLLTIVLVASCILPNITFGTDWKDVNQFDNKSDQNLDESVRTVVGTILNVTRIIATGIAIIMLTVLAMKYMMSAPGDRADIKKHAVVYVVGAIVLFAASGILGIIQTFSNNFAGTGAST